MPRSSASCSATGRTATDYNFCDVRPASIAGNVSDCLANQPLSGVTVQLLDAQGNVIGTTTTNAQGNYQFTNLTPGRVTYGVSEILPSGYMHNDEDVGTAPAATIVNYRHHASPARRWRRRRRATTSATCCRRASAAAS